jgi:hypothetical protein
LLRKASFFASLQRTSGLEIALTSSGQGTLVGQVTYYATLRASLAELAQLRRQPGILPGEKIAPTFLKHAEEHTVAALAVALRALAKGNYEPGQYREWGVLAAPVMFGRDAEALAMNRFAAEGAWGISPHMIPHYSLHAVSGTISQALQIRGPNFGISGGPSALSEAFLVAAGLLSENRLPGILLVLTGYDREKIPGESPEAQPLIHCEAAALVLTREGGQRELRLGVQPRTHFSFEPFTLAAFREALENIQQLHASWSLPGIGWLELKALELTGR